MNTRSLLVAAAAACVTLGLALPTIADVTGKVTYKGKAPVRQPLPLAADANCAGANAGPVLDQKLIVGKNNELANVFVSVKNPPKAAAGAKVEAKEVVLDQKGCMYTPHVIALQVGQDVVVKNSDAFLHNVHTVPFDNPSENLGQPGVNPGQKLKPLKITEILRVKCDVHPWMDAWIGVFDNPFFAITGEDGTYTIKGLPDGKYTLNFFQESIGDAEKTVTVKDGKIGADEGTVEMEQLPNAVMPTIREINVSQETGMPSCCSGKTDDADAAKSPKSDAAKSELKAD